MSERALHLEIHRMNRIHQELLARNAALESECARLRTVTNHERAKLVADHIALMKKCAAHQTSEQEMTHTLQLERNALITKTKELDAEKIAMADKLEAEKRTMSDNLEAAKRAIVAEYEAEKKARIEREEEHVSYFWARVEELNKIKVEKMQEQEDEKRAFQAECEKRLEERIQTATQQVMKTVPFSQLSGIISANYAQTQLVYRMGFRDKRVLLYSHYSEQNEVESYNYLTLQRMDHLFDYVIVLTNCPNKWDFPAEIDYNKYHTLGYNFKSDFRNYAVFIMQTAQGLMHASRLCLANDSFVIVDVPAYDNCMRSLFETPGYDFAGITSSHENEYHVQSYFMCFNTTAVIQAVVAYFDAHGLPSNHNASISVYELGMTKHLTDRGFASRAMVTNADMQYPLNTTYCKWSAVLQNAGIIKRQHLLKQYPPRFAMSDYNIALVANKFSQNLHFIHYLQYHGINVD
jgi:rhamnosyltransferase